MEGWDGADPEASYFELATLAAASDHILWFRGKSFWNVLKG